MKEAAQLQEIRSLPDLLRFENGERVKTPEDWIRRRAELTTLYSEYIYGYIPDREKETVTWSLQADSATGGTLMHITVNTEKRSASFSVLAGIPALPEPEDGWPFYVEYWPWHYRNWFTGEWVTGFSENCRYAMERGYACIQYDCAQVSADNDSRTGAFYTLYPYGQTNPAEQRGVLLAWAWGVSKVIDALEAGAGKALGINPRLSMVGGVSRYGKSTAVAGAYDERIRVTIPSCSGAGGTAVFRTNNQGKTYDLTSLGGPEQWTNESPNEPFSNLQGGEGYWFCGNFAQIPSMYALPVDQHMLCALAAGTGRHLIAVTGIVSEGWNNTEGQCLAYAAARPAWELLGLGSQIGMIIHLDGHAILRSDMEMILDYCDACLKDVRQDGLQALRDRMKGDLFLRENRDRLDPAFAPYIGDKNRTDGEKEK